MVETIDNKQVKIVKKSHYWLDKNVIAEPTCFDDNIQFIIWSIKEGRVVDEYRSAIEIDTDYYTKKIVPVSPCPWKLPEMPEDYGTIGDLYDEVRSFIEKYFDYPDERAYDVFTSWILANWIPEWWFSVPFLSFHGPEGCGKTRALEIISSIGYRAWHIPNVTPAVVFRADEQYGPTYLFDEAEYLNGENKGEIIGLINARNKKGTSVPRISGVSEGKPEIGLFNVYGFTAISSTRNLPKTTRSRCILFEMSPSFRRLPLFIDESEALFLRNKLLNYRFDQLAIKKKSSPVSLFEGEGYEGFSGRTLELFSPLLSVAPESKQQIIIDFMYSRENRNRQAAQSESNFRILDAFCKLAILNGPEVSVSSIADEVNKMLPLDEYLKNQQIGYVLKNLGIQSKHTKRGNCYIYDEVHVKRLSLRFTELTIPSKSSQPSPQNTESSTEYVNTPNYKSDTGNTLADASGMLKDSVLQSSIRKTEKENKTNGQ